MAISWRCTPIGYRCKGAAAIIHRHQGALPDRTVPDCQPMMSLSAGVKAQQGCCARRSTPMWHQHQTWRGNTHRGGAVEFPAQRPSGHSSLSDHRRAAAALPDLRLSFDESGVHANFEIEQARKETPHPLTLSRDPQSTSGCTRALFALVGMCSRVSEAWVNPTSRHMAALEARRLSHAWLFAISE